MVDVFPILNGHLFTLAKIHRVICCRDIFSIKIDHLPSCESDMPYVHVCPFDKSMIVDTPMN